MKRIRQGLLFFVFIVSIALVVQPAISEAKDFHSKIFADLAREAKKSVVYVFVGANLFSDSPVIIGTGTGFFVGDDGLIVTADHIIKAGGTEVGVTLFTKEKFKAKIVARRPDIDLAILKIEGDTKGKVYPLKLGDSDKVEDGDIVMAIGHPMSFLWSITVGVISGRRMNEEKEYLQTDTAINFGNSGSPLLNLEGEVIGIVSGIAQGAQNISLAISSNVVRDMFDQGPDRK